MAAIQKYAPTPIRLAPVSDFTGGWNLRADAFQLGPNESPDMLDMTVEIGGGFVQRNVVQPYATPLGAGHTIQNMWSFTAASITQVVAQHVAAGVSNFSYTTGGAWTTITAASATQKARATVFNNNLYLVQGATAPVRWTGTAATALGQAYNETIGGEGAADGNMPKARLICSHAGRVFVAYTTEGGTDFPSRLRWSHVGFAEDWRSEDFIDIDVGRDGDVITALVEFRDRLYVFKNNSISILSGYGTANFAVTTISQDIGAVSQEAAVVTDVGLFTFSWPQGVYLDRTGTGPYPIFDKLFPVIRDGTLPSAYRNQIAMGWVNQMLWCSIPYGSGATVNTRTIVYNPWIYKNRYLRFLQGPWYPYSLGIGAFARQLQPSGPTLFLASKAADQFVGQLDQQGSTDNWGAGATDIASYFRTRWMDLGSPSVIKRWRHPDVAMRDPGQQQVLVEVRKDYNPSIVYKTFQLSTASASTGMLWDDGTGTVGGKWDAGLWSDIAVNSEVIARGGSMGSARAVQLSFYAPTGQTWGVDAVSFKYIPKRVRG